MNTERLQRTMAAMERAGYDALVCRLPENVLMLSGYWPLCGWVFYVFPVQGRPVCILPNTEEAEASAALWDAECLYYRYGTLDAEDQFESIRKCLANLARDRGWKTVGFEGDFENIAPAWNAAELYVPAERTRQLLRGVFGEGRLRDATGLLREQRACKTPYEIEKLRIANEISCFALAAFRERVAPGVKAIELAAAVEAEVMIRGTGYRDAVKVRAFAQVAAGPAETSMAYRPMEVTTARRLEDSEIALLELAVVADGFWADRTRACIAGEPTALQREVNEIVTKAQEAAIAAAEPGKRAGDVDAAARRLIAGAGYDREFMHITGHAVGFCYHEPFPMITPDSDDVLQEGMVHSVEPGIYFPGFGGIRVEDNVLITRSGHEVLGPFPKTL